MAINLNKELFRPLEKSSNESEKIVRASLSFWKDAWRRLKMNKAAMLGLTVLVVLTIMAIVGPMMVNYTYFDQNLSQLNKAPGAEHWLGTDYLGRDMWSRLWWGTRISLLIGIVAAFLDLVIGVLYGGISGFFGGKIDDIMMRIVEIMLGIPTLIIVIILIIIFQPGFWTIVMAMAITGWIGMARLVRGQILQLKEQDYVLAAKALGASNSRILLKHLIPNTLGPIIVSVTFTVPGAIFSEAFLSFIGLGIRAPLASLGTLINEGYKLLKIYPWELLYPALALSLIMLSFNLLGDGLRDALDPKLRK